MAVILALLLANGAITFHNVWPTLGIRWPGELSIELAVLLVVLALSNALLGPTPRRLIGVLAAVLVLFAIGRYAEVTAPALYGREINLYWDLQHVGALAGMLTAVAPAWAVAAGALGLIVLLTLFFLGARWSLRTIDDALRARSAQFGFGLFAAVLIVWFAAQRVDERIPRVPQFSIPVSQTYATQIARVLDTFANSQAVRSLPPSPPLDSDLGALERTDVIVVFMESYGRTTYDRPEISGVVDPARERFETAVRDTHRAVASAFVTSPTFGGSSWFAHSSFLSGIEVANPDRYALLLTQHRPTLVSTFKAAGYRAVALMPGLKKDWPEGAFYGFDKIYGTDSLAYRGPEFGWWRIPDQFSLAALDAREISPRPRRPLFVFFPTVSTHMPFRPTPPLQKDWARVLSATPYDADEVSRSITATPQWTNMGGSYAGSVRYAFDVLATYLRERPNEHFVLLVLGDHQPAANVSGEGASWDVPVHLISDRPDLIEKLVKDGFVQGMRPDAKSIGPMHTLGPMLLDAFGTPMPPAILDGHRPPT
jgi:hypothetical protein